MRDLGLLAMRLTIGGLLAGHGAQKLFGWFGGGGIHGTGGWLETLGLRPGHRWATLAGIGEFGGGIFTALGLFNPVGPIMMLGPMSIATGTVHWGKPIWATQGGAELPVINMAVGIGLAMTGPGTYSLDRLLGIKVPGYAVALTVAGVGTGIAVTLANRRVAQEQGMGMVSEEQAQAASREPQPGGIGDTVQLP